MKDEESDEIKEGELVEERPKDMVRVPTNVNELSALTESRGVQIIEQRAQILTTLRVAALRLVMPSDVTLFKSPDGNVTGFIGDSGCDRVKALFGIRIEHLGPMERIEEPDTHEFAYRITGDGSCAITGEAVLDMEGIRYSIEPYAQQKAEGLMRTVAVQKAARANLDGSITRELAGLKSIPSQEFERAWEGTWKKLEMCNKGRGFGTGDQRTGAGGETSGGIEAADIPTCGFCKDSPKLVFRPAKGDRAAFWGCRNYAAHPKDKMFVDHGKLLAELEKRKAAAAREPGEE